MSQVSIEELRASMRAAQVYGKGQYFSKGLYLLKVKLMKYQRTMVDNVLKESIVVEFEVLETSNPEVLKGETRSVVFAFHNQGWLSRFKAFVLALVGVNPDGNVDPAAQEAAIDIYVALRDDNERKRLELPEQIGVGMLVHAEAIPGTSRKGNPVTNMKWTPVAASA